MGGGPEARVMGLGQRHHVETAQPNSTPKSLKSKKEYNVLVTGMGVGNPSPIQYLQPQFAYSTLQPLPSFVLTLLSPSPTAWVVATQNHTTPPTS